MEEELATCTTCEKEHVAYKKRNLYLCIFWSTHDLASLYLARNLYKDIILDNFFCILSHLIHINKYSHILHAKYVTKIQRARLLEYKESFFTSHPVLRENHGLKENSYFLSSPFVSSLIYPWYKFVTFTSITKNRVLWAFWMA